MEKETIEIKMKDSIVINACEELKLIKIHGKEIQTLKELKPNDGEAYQIHSISFTLVKFK